jgi:hypothetical protein
VILDHVLNSQIFDDNKVVIQDQRVRQLVEKIFALVGYIFVVNLQGVNGFSAVTSTLHSSGYCAL